MTNTSRDLVRRLALEFVVVVMGILAALAVDDWRDSRADHALEGQLLQRLLQDLEADSADAARLRQSVEARGRAADELIHALSGQSNMEGDPVSAPSSPESLSEALADLVFMQALEVSDGTYREMLATGSVRVIQDADLRAQIAEYYTTMARLVEIPRRQPDLRPDLMRALAEVGVVPGESPPPPDLVRRLHRDSAILAQVRGVQMGLRSGRIGLGASLQSNLRASIRAALAAR